jgi:NADH-quinone oxidoreductase subunit N
MLAYSSIAHAGYALVGFLGAGMATTVEKRDAAIASVAFYMLTYAITNLGAFRRRHFARAEKRPPYGI